MELADQEPHGVWGTAVEMITLSLLYSRGHVKHLQEHGHLFDGYRHYTLTLDISVAYIFCSIELLM